jgi:hypothetical protein
MRFYFKTTYNVVINGLLTTALGAVSVAQAAEFEFHGDLNNRFLLYGNQLGFMTTNRTRGDATTAVSPDGTLGSLREGVPARVDEDGVEDNFGEIKYRFWTTAATDDDAVKGVLAVEIGGLRFGNENEIGATFSGDGINIETRWAYTDFALPSFPENRLTIGLQPFALNPYLWQETAMGVALQGPISDTTTYNAAWMRGRARDKNAEDNFEDLDSLSARFGFTPFVGATAGVFGLYQHARLDDGDGTNIVAEGYEVKQLGNVDLDLFSIGVDGSYIRPIAGNEWFLNWDLIFQTGEIKNARFFAADNYTGIPNASGDFDVTSFFGRLDAGTTLGPTTLTYTFWYASGDDNPNDDDFNAFIATDVDVTASTIFFEGNIVDDTYHSERPYLLDKGFILNKLAVDHQVTDKLTAGAAVLYLALAEDVEYTDFRGNNRDESALGWEINASMQYQLYESLEFGAVVGYLISDDAMDFYEAGADRDGNADADIFHAAARVRFKF